VPGGPGDNLPAVGVVPGLSGSAALRREAMRTLRWALVLAVPVVWVVAARSAEPVSPEADDVTVQLLLLRQKSVQQELNLSPEVIKKVLDFTSKESEEYENEAKLSKEEGEKKSEELEKANEKFLQDNLTDAQRKRLHQIDLQVTGLRHLTRPEAAKALDLTEEQQKKFKELDEEAIKELKELIKDKEGRNEKLAKLRAETHKKIEAILTDEQKAKVKEMVGEPFKGEIVFEEP
jgi:Spy/CpxP family protein refolding chaperone